MLLDLSSPTCEMTRCSQIFLTPLLLSDNPQQTLSDMGKKDGSRPCELEHRIQISLVSVHILAHRFSCHFFFCQSTTPRETQEAREPSLTASSHLRQRDDGEEGQTSRGQGASPGTLGTNMSVPKMGPDARPRNWRTQTLGK